MKIKSFIALIIIPACFLILSGCHQAANNGSVNSGVNVIDAEGKTVTINDSSRIVSVGTAISETLYALGAGSHVVGVDNSSSEYIKDAGGLPKVGPRTTLAAEGILALKPTLLIVTADAGPPQVIDQLRNASVTTLTLPVDYTVDAVKDKVRRIARALGAEAKGEQLANSIDGEMSEVRDLLAHAQTKPKVMFVGRGPNMPNATMSGTGTTIDEMIRLAGGTNPMNNFQGFREMTDEAVVNAAPDVILMTEKSFERSGGIDGVLKFPGVILTPAGKNRRIVAVSDMYFQGFGPSVGHAVRDLALKLHPELNATGSAVAPSPTSEGEHR
jgi:iron complex transport system substrate-binding protein